MSLTLAAALAAAAETHNELPIPAPLFGVIVLGLFGLGAIVTWSYRNVANRHRQVSGRLGGDGSGHTSAKDG
jgi:hypothetical protein